MVVLAREIVARRGKQFVLSRVKSRSLSVCSPNSGSNNNDATPSKIKGEKCEQSAMSNLLAFVHGVADFEHDYTVQCDVLLARKQGREAAVRLSSQHEDGDDGAAYSMSFAKPNVCQSSSKTKHSNVQSAKHLAESLSRGYSPTMKDDTAFDTTLPRTLSDALKSSNHARVITKAVPPFEVVSVNPAWEDLCGYTKEVSVGKTLDMLQGAETSDISATLLVSHMVRSEGAGTILVNHKVDGTKFYHRLSVRPLTSDGNADRITHFLGVAMEVEKPTSAFGMNP